MRTVILEIYDIKGRFPLLPPLHDRMAVLAREDGETELNEAWYHDDGKFYYGHKEDCPESLDIVEWAYLPKGI